MAEEVRKPAPQAKMVDPNWMPPPPPPGNQVFFDYHVGDQVQVNPIGRSGLITAAAVNNTGGIVYLVDDGRGSPQWYAQAVITPMYLHGPLGPLGPEPLEK